MSVYAGQCTLLPMPSRWTPTNVGIFNLTQKLDGDWYTWIDGESQTLPLSTVRSIAELLGPEALSYFDRVEKARQDHHREQAADLRCRAEEAERQI